MIKMFMGFLLAGARGQNIGWGIGCPSSKTSWIGMNFLEPAQHSWFWFPGKKEGRGPGHCSRIGKAGAGPPWATAPAAVPAAPQGAGWVSLRYRAPHGNHRHPGSQLKPPALRHPRNYAQSRRHAPVTVTVTQSHTLTNKAAAPRGAQPCMQAPGRARRRRAPRANIPPAALPAGLLGQAEVR